MSEMKRGGALKAFWVSLVALLCEIAPFAGTTGVADDGELYEVVISYYNNGYGDNFTWEMFRHIEAVVPMLVVALTAVTAVMFLLAVFLRHRGVCMAATVVCAATALLSIVVLALWLDYIIYIGVNVMLVIAAVCGKRALVREDASGAE